MKKQISFIIRDINERFAQERQSNPDAKSCSFTLHYGHSLFEVYITRDEVQVNILNERHYDHFYETLTRYIEERITDWDDVELEEEPSYWDVHGFRDEADYNRYRYAI